MTTTKSMMAMVALVAMVALALAGACGTGVPKPGNNAPPITGPDPCASEGFRQPTPDSTVCPGAPMCACTGGDICCLTAVDATKGVCESIGRCRTFALQCDGPEDCGASPDGGVSTSPDAGASARVCCLDESVGMTGGGSECRAASACTGTNKILCRSDDDCLAVMPSLPRCHPADYGTPGVEDRGLDGLIGYCAK